MTSVTRATTESILPPLTEPIPGIGPLGVRVLGDSGPVVVLIHGLGRVAATWTLVSQALNGRVRLVLPDNPGFGRSRDLKVPNTIDGHAALHEATLRALDLPRPYHIAGLSLGGMIGPALAARLGNDAASVTLFATSALESGLWRLAPGSLLRMGGRFLVRWSFDHRVNMPELVRPEVLRAQPGLIAALNDLQTREGFSACNGFRQLLAALKFRLRPLASRLPPRRFVIVGTGDRLVSPKNSRRVAKLLNAPILELPNRGHDLGIDAPKDVAEILAAVAAGIDPGTLNFT